jgi:hypothetical protein
VVLQGGDAFAAGVRRCGKSGKGEGAFERVQGDSICDCFDESGGFACNEDAHIFDPDVDVVFGPDFGADFDQLAGESLLAEIISCLDNNGDQIPVFDPAVWRRAPDAFFLLLPGLADCCC